jgi:hypothetical protein
MQMEHTEPPAKVASTGVLGVASEAKGRPMTTEATESQQHSPPMGVSSSEGLGAWVPTANRLPDEETPVLLIRNGAIVIGERRWERPTWEETFSPFWFWACVDDNWHDDQGDATVTHWMPLPAPPVST